MFVKHIWWTLLRKWIIILNILYVSEGGFGESSKCISCQISISGWKLMESGVQQFIYDFILFSSGDIREGGDLNKIVL